MGREGEACESEPGANIAYLSQEECTQSGN